MWIRGFSFWIKGCFLLALVSIISGLEPELGFTRVVFQTKYGDIEFGFYPTVASKTVDHIFKLVRLGGYNTNHFFRVDKGFVAQVADVANERSTPVNEEQRREAVKTVVGEFSEVKHVRGILSMGRYDDPDSASSSFSILLGDAPHLDGKYAIFGKVTKGDEMLTKLENISGKKGTYQVRIHVYCEKMRTINLAHSVSNHIWMPMECITILSSYYYDTETENCEQDRSILKLRPAASAVEVERQRASPGAAVKLCLGDLLVMGSNPEIVPLHMQE
ncbi:Peptidyl-prolyl cis-trans isomerase CYP23 [Glycine max]|nr:Peptidyl-prolyl cis-trans isomerase CYP23 [Glycine max]